MMILNDFQLTYSLRKYAGRKSFVLPCAGAPEMCVDRYLWYFEKCIFVLASTRVLTNFCMVHHPEKHHSDGRFVLLCSFSHSLLVRHVGSFCRPLLTFNSCSCLFCPKTGRNNMRAGGSYLHKGHSRGSKAGLHLPHVYTRS